MISPGLILNHMSLGRVTIFISVVSSNGHPYCYPFQLRHSAEVGRYLVASRDIQPLELILEDQPSVVGPSRKQPALNHVICVECFRRVTGDLTCQLCHFPICSEDCLQVTGAWHRSMECKYFQV